MIFGIDVELTTARASGEALADALDTIHDALTSNAAVYSADIVLEDGARAYLLTGVEVDGTDEGPADLAVATFHEALSDALNATGIDDWLVTASPKVHQMANAGR